MAPGLENLNYVVGKSEVTADELIATLRPFVVTYEPRNRTCTLLIGRSGPHDQLAERLELASLNIVGGGFLAFDDGCVLIGGDSIDHEGVSPEALAQFRDAFVHWFDKRGQLVRELVLLKVDRVHPFWGKAPR
jgi:hypothetical protein